MGHCLQTEKENNGFEFTMLKTFEAGYKILQTNVCAMLATSFANESI